MKKYNAPIINIFLFEKENVVTTSGINYEAAKEALNNYSISSQNITTAQFADLDFKY